MLERDADLLERLEGCAQRAFAGTVHRVVWADRNPLQGSSASRGRWNSPDSGFEVLNTSLDAEGAAAEFEAFWSLFEQRLTRPALSWKLRVRLWRVVELDFERLEKLGVRHAEYANRQYSLAEPVLGWIRCDPSVMQLTGKLL